MIATPRTVLDVLADEVHLSRQDRDVLVVCCIAAPALVAALTGTAWGLLSLARLIHPKKETA